MLSEGGGAFLGGALIGASRPGGAFFGVPRPGGGLLALRLAAIARARQLPAVVVQNLVGAWAHEREARWLGLFVPDQW